MRHVTREEVREVDRAAIDDYGMPGAILMENAGRGATDVALDMLGSGDTSRSRSASADRASGACPPAHVAIVCGRGNNGGDGYVVARHLHNRGIASTVHLLAPRDKIGGDALINLEIIERMTLDIRRSEPGDLDFSPADLIVDAMLGTGLAGEVREPYLSAINAINDAGKPVLGIDIPSGLDANTGAILGNCVRATRTATFALPKIGFTRESGPDVTGEVTVIDIGVPREILE